MPITRAQVPRTPAAQLRENMQLDCVRATCQSLRRFVLHRPRRELARIPPPPSPLFEEVSPRGQHAAPAADLVGRCGQGLLPCRRRDLCGGLLRGPQVDGGPVFQRSCSGTEPPSLSLSTTNLFILLYCVWEGSGAASIYCNMLS